MNGYKVSINQRQDSYEHDGQEYGSWSSSNSNSFDSISRCAKYPDVICPIKFKEGDKCYVVWVEYSTGDSFGHADRGSVESIGVFKDYACAEELQEQLLKFNPDVNTNDWENKYRFEYQTSDGQEFKIGFVPWVGYFETLDEVHISKAVMK